MHNQLPQDNYSTHTNSSLNGSINNLSMNSIPPSMSGSNNNIYQYALPTSGEHARSVYNDNPKVFDKS